VKEEKEEEEEEEEEGEEEEKNVTSLHLGKATHFVALSLLEGIGIGIMDGENAAAAVHSFT
jgi:hypothetical protein